MPTPLIEDYLSILSLVVRKLDRVYIVVDALDELDGVFHREEFINTLLGLSNIQLFVTSREYIQPIKGSTTLQIQPDPQDINAYVKDKIQRSVRLRNFIQPSLEAKILDTVEHKYSNMYV